jgi:hypothetical protein
LKLTNCTISFDWYYPVFEDFKGLRSASSYSIDLKSALPTPTIIIESGSSDATTISSIVSY